MSDVEFFAFLALCLTAIVSVVIRYRRSTGKVRAQLKWLMLAGLAAVLYPFVCGAEIIVTGDTGIVATVVGIVALVSLRRPSAWRCSGTTCTTSTAWWPTPSRTAS